jgi:electron transport complex protein RnfB
MSTNSGDEVKIYEKLADTLNKIPNGFPRTSDGSHIKLLQWIFTPEEAELASKMKLRAETIEELSSRLKIPLEGLKDRLETMVTKGQIQALDTRSSGRKYGIIPFVVGIYEHQINRMDKEFAEIFENFYNKTHFHEILGNRPYLHKVIPINKVIKPELTIYPYESAELMLKNAKSWGIRDCICKKQQELIGKPCKYPKKVCIIFSKVENAFENSTRTESITKEEALIYLQEAEEAGLIHSSMNIQSGHNYICNCCTCCCGILRAVTKREVPLASVNSNYIMTVDEESCIGCESCIERCQFGALDVINNICQVDSKKCVGCGVCAIVCPEDALTLIERKESEKTEPPNTLRDWMTARAFSRQVDPSDLL